MDFKGFNISETNDGLSVSFTHRELFILSKILLSAKFPPDYIFNTNELLNPYLNQLIDAVSDRLDRLSSAPVTPFEIPRTDPFVKAVFKAIDDAITYGKANAVERDDLLRLAFKPHKVEGFK
jgi:hypothetical protein